MIGEEASVSEVARVDRRGVRCERERAGVGRRAVQANVAQGAFCATAPTKYAPKTAVMTTVVYAELAKS